MKLTVGLGSVDEYIRFSEAGADEFFCGYVPYSWTQKYDTMMPLNRREVLCSNVQLGAFSELEILASHDTGLSASGSSDLQLSFLSAGSVSGDR